jgi:hypothetical protein
MLINFFYIKREKYLRDCELRKWTNHFGFSRTKYRFSGLVSEIEAYPGSHNYNVKR